MAQKVALSLSLNCVLAFGFFLSLSQGDQAVSRTFKRVDVPGFAISSWAFSSSNIMSATSCVSNCLANSPTCNFAYYDQVQKTCFLGTTKATNTFYKKVPPSIVSGYLEFGQLKNTLSLYTQTTPLATSNWNNFVYTSSVSSQQDYFWDCLNMCYNVYQDCAYFVLANSTCNLGNVANIANPVPFSKEKIYTLTSFLNSALTPTSTMSGANWSKKIFQHVSAVSTATHCSNYCFLPMTPVCHFYVFISGSCFLGNFLVTTSVIAARTDDQVLYASTVPFYPVNAIDFTNFFRIASGSNVGDCLIACVASSDCQYTSFLSGTGCLIGNFARSRTSFSQPSSITAYVLKDVVASQNYPDSKYFSASVSNTVWTPKITTSMSGVKSEGLCSALCTLRYPNCQLYVFLTPVCYMGTLATNNGNVGANPGTYTMMTRILFQSFPTYGSGPNFFASYCPTGFNLLSCGSANSQYSNAETFRSWFPIGSTGCYAYDAYGMALFSWCTTMPVSSFYIATASGNGSVTSTCPGGTVAIGCSQRPLGLLREDWKRAKPLNDRMSCECYGYFGNICFATCASNVINYEMVSATSSGDIYATCTIPNNIVLGCGFQPNQVDLFSTALPVFPNSCVCHNGNQGTCFAICGQLQY